MKSISFRGAALCGLSLLALTPIARAAEAALQPFTVAAADVPAQPVVVTATRIAQPVEQVLGDVRVIDQQQLRNAAGLTLPELLQLQAGVDIASNGGPGQLSNFYVRGTNANHVVVLLDGVRINSASQGTTALQFIPLSQVERIEVLRGPGSSLYGADAIGGVIQIFTKQGAHTDARVGFGSERTREASAGLGRSFGDTSVSLNVAHRRTAGFSARSDATGANQDDDASRDTSVGLNVSHEWLRDHRLVLRGFTSRAHTHFDDFAFDPVTFASTETDGLNRQRLSSLTLESQNRFSGSWLSTARLARSVDRLTTYGPNAGIFNTRQDQFSWQNNLSVLGGTLAAGYEWRREEVGGDASAYTQTRRIVNAVFGSYAATLGAHGIEASLRHDHDSQFGGNGTGRLAYGYQLTPAWRLTATAGTAFKAPTFNDLYLNLPAFQYFGNPDLRPERSRSLEAGLRYDDGARRAGMTLFRNKIKDLIQFVSDPVTFDGTVVNIGQARIRGATLDAGHTMALWNARAEVTLMSPENASTGRRLTRRAEQFGSVSANWTPGAWRAGVEVVASGDRFADVANTTRLSGFALLNLRAGYALTPEWTLSARLNNAADKKYELTRFYSTPGRNFFVALEYAAK